MKGTEQITVTMPPDLLEAVDRERAQSKESRGAAVHRILETALRDTDKPELERTFHALVQQWQAETAVLSSARQKAMHPTYQRIIGMGPAVLPLIFQELETHPAHWLWALQAITGENPAESCESFQQAADAWLQWGRARGLAK
jgi:hypothetical protein